MSIADVVHLKIQKKLSQIESDFNVTVIMAIESGSRAWGFESPNSDYDIRFIYVNNLDWYLNVYPQRDVIDVHDVPFEDDLDFSGWDLKKACALMQEGNPTLLEWFHSPIVYRWSEQATRMLTLALGCFQPKKSLYSYLSMSKGNHNDLFKADLVKYKKYLYVLRGLFCCKWIEKNNTSPPMLLQTLRDDVTDEPVLFKSDLNVLLRQKRSGAELAVGPSIDSFAQFITQHLAYYSELAHTINSRETVGVRDIPTSKENIRFEVQKFFISVVKQ